MLQIQHLQGGLDGQLLHEVRRREAAHDDAIVLCLHMQVAYPSERALDDLPFEVPQQLGIGELLLLGKHFHLNR